MRIYDTIVIGGGPAGSLSAALCARGGLTTLLVDRRVFPRPKLCGGLLTYKALRLLDRVFATSGDDLRRRGVINHQVSTYTIRVASDRTFEGTLACPGDMVDRSVFDTFLLDRAREEGAEIATGVAVREFDFAQHQLTMGSGEVVGYRLLIAADGANSQIRRRLQDEGRIAGTREAWDRNSVMGLEVALPPEIHPERDRVLIHTACCRWGYGWVFPHSDRTLIGLGGLRRQNPDLSASLDAYILEVLGGGGSAYRRRGHPIPFGSLLPQVAADGVLLTGDAAGFPDPITGEGIYHAMRGGELASLAAVAAADTGTPASRLYQRLVDRYLGDELHRACLWRRVLYGGPTVWRAFAHSALFGRFAGPFFELLHGFRCYRTLGRSQIYLAAPEL